MKTDSNRTMQNGRLAREPFVAASGKVVKFEILNSFFQGKDANGNPKKTTNSHRVKVWGWQAQALAEAIADGTLGKGVEVEVYGRSVINRFPLEEACGRPVMKDGRQVWMERTEIEPTEGLLIACKAEDGRKIFRNLLPTWDEWNEIQENRVKNDGPAFLQAVGEILPDDVAASTA